MRSSTFTSSLKALTILAASTATLASNPEVSISSRDVALPLAVNTIYEGSVPTWFENLAVRENGQLIISRDDTPAIWQVDPTGVLPPIVLSTFNTTAHAGCLGIAETSTDIFYVVLQAPYNQTTFIKTDPSLNASVFKLDMTEFAVDADGEVTTNATVSKLVDLPDAGFLNGMITLNATEGYLLLADSILGVIYRLDVNTGEYTIIMDGLTGSASFPLGVNGLKLFDDYLYYSNSGVPVFARIPIDTFAGVTTGPAELVANISLVDDFVFRADGTAWMCQNRLESLSMIVDGNTTLVAGSPTETTLAGVTAGQFGRTDATKNILYLTTNGGLAQAVNGTIVTGGKIAWIDTTGYP